MSVNNISSVIPLQPITTPPIQRSTPSAAAAPTAETGDSLELSGVGQLFQSLQANTIRPDKVADIKSQIEAGTYEDDTKLNGAVDKLLDDLNG